MRSEQLPADVDAAIALAGAKLGLFAGRLLWHATVTSTSDIALRLASAGAPEGTVVAANAQTQGRGRLGRQWVSPPEAGLYVSAVLRPSAEAASLLTIAAGVAIAEGLEAATGLRALLKWPNDVYAGDRKLAGILAEAGTTGGAVEHTVLGFGINVSPATYPADVSRRATSLETEIGRPVDRGLVLVECLAAIAGRYRELREGRGREVVARWRLRGQATFGRRVEWDVPGGQRQGTAEDIDAAGALIVRSGAEHLRLVSGEVRWTT